VRLRDDPRPTTAVATTTLELGIDIGEVETVAQIGPGFSVASLRQRLGRSGRRAGNPAILRMFSVEAAPDRGAHPLDRLNLDLVQSIAMVECLLAKWCEPPARAGLHLSTLIHQVMALILQTGGIRALPAWSILCDRGPFRSVDKAMFADLLRCMAVPTHQLIEQSPDGLLMLGKIGEREAESHEFYPVFVTEREYRIIHDAKTLGTYPLTSPIAKGETIIFGGRRWRIVDFDDSARVIVVGPAKGAKPPRFRGQPGAVHDRIVAEMRQILAGSGTYRYIDATAAELLEHARQAYRDLGLETNSVIPLGEGALIFPWVGTKKLKTLLFALTAGNFEGADFGHAIELQNTSAAAVDRFLSKIVKGEGPDAAQIASRVAQPQISKFDHYLTPELLSLVTLRERLEVETLVETASKVIGPASIPVAQIP
jgi:ATP-dependent Lhr-like helicase